MQTDRVASGRPTLPTIAIIGGGPGGLTLARLLSLRGVSPTVFELDEHPMARPQGGSLDLHGESGLRALYEAGLELPFAEVARYEDQGDAFYDAAGTLHFSFNQASEGDRPEIDRTQLRDLLLASLPAGCVRWGSKIRAVEAVPGGGRHRVIGEHGPLGEFDLVVGADGAWSKVRPLVSAVTPHFTEVLFFELEIDEMDRRHPHLTKLLPSGKLSAVGRSRSMIAQRSSGDHTRVYVMFRVAEAELYGPHGLVARFAAFSPAEARAELRAMLPGWAPELLAFIDAGEGSRNEAVKPRPIVSLPVGHRWDHRAGVTLLGDAAHVMSPFSGEGVNMAMLDALELANALSGALAVSGDLEAAIAEYEAQMFERAAVAAAGATEGLSYVSEDALTHVLEHIREHLAPGAAA